MFNNTKVFIALLLLVFLSTISSCKKCVYCVATEPTTGELKRSEGVCESKNYVEGFESGFTQSSLDSGWTSDCVDLR
jgi:hypothetical protein